jgi:hypothetical protein
MKPPVMVEVEPTGCGPRHDDIADSWRGPTADVHLPSVDAFRIRVGGELISQGVTLESAP